MLNVVASCSHQSVTPFPLASAPSGPLDLGLVHGLATTSASRSSSCRPRCRISHVCVFLLRVFDFKNESSTSYVSPSFRLELRLLFAPHSINETAAVRSSLYIRYKQITTRRKGKHLLGSSLNFRICFEISMPSPLTNP